MDCTVLGRIFKSESTTKPKGYPGLWQFPKDPEKCCIYRVPESLRRVNPEAYTPQLVIIGPLHHYMKIQALKSLGDITNTKSMGYVNMEEHKKIYLAKFAERFAVGNEIINGFRRMIEEDEERIRESYSESTTWIESSEFVDMILHDCVFILEFLLRKTQNTRGVKTGDPVIDEPCLTEMIVKAGKDYTEWMKLFFKFYNLKDMLFQMDDQN